MNTNHWSLPPYGLLACLAIIIAGCGAHQDAHPDAEACEHLKHGPSVTLTAANSAGAAPLVEPGHKRYDITLVDGVSGRQGVVRLASSEKTDYVFLLGANVPIRFLDANDGEVTAEQSAASSPGCAEIKGRHLVELEVGTYAISLGPTAQTAVSLVVEEAAHDH